MRITAVCLWLAASTSLSGGEPPAASLDLSLWRLTLPVDTDRAGTPDEVDQPDLKSFEDPRYFFVNDQATGVVFRAHCGGHTTKGSSYPRCELREMTEHGTRRAAWDTDGDVVHTMTMKVAITATPAVKKHVVCAQIHDAEDDLLMVRLEGTKLFLERNSVGDVMLNREYELGTPIDLKIQAGAGKVRVWHDGELKMNWRVSKTGCYFKAGCYTQSNPGTGDTKDSFGEVVVFRLKVEHSRQP
jgi:poly(beta-D-mannuronate) lyase